MKDNYHGSSYRITKISITSTGLVASSLEIVEDTFFTAHGVGNLIAWNFLITIGYIAARFLRHYPWWSYLHFVGGTIPCLYSFSVSIAAIIKSNFILFQ